MIKDFLVVVGGDEFESVGPKLSDMCKDLGATFLVFSSEGFLLLGVTPLLPFFVEDCDADIRLELGFGVGIDSLRVEFFGALVMGDSDFFFSVATFASFFTVVAYSIKIAEKCETWYLTCQAKFLEILYMHQNSTFSTHI